MRYLRIKLRYLNVCRKDILIGVSYIHVSTGFFSDGGQRTIVMDEEFFHGYRKTLVKPDEVLLNILIPFTRQVIVSTGHNLQTSQTSTSVILTSRHLLLLDGVVRSAGNIVIFRHHLKTYLFNLSNLMYSSICWQLLCMPHDPLMQSLTKSTHSLILKSKHLLRKKF